MTMHIVRRFEHLAPRSRSRATVTAPSLLNQVTINRYRVKYRRTTTTILGVDVPYDFDSAFTIRPCRAKRKAGVPDRAPLAKEEAPLAALRYTDDIISTIAEVTFYGRDQAGNEVSASANIGIDFGDFADPAW